MSGAAALQAGDMASISLLLQGVMGVRDAKPVGLDTDAIASTLGGLGRNMVVQTDDNAEGPDEAH